MSGFSFIESAEANIEARKQAGASGGKQWFQIESGESAIVRFIDDEEDVKKSSGWMHQLPAEPGKQFGQKIPCLAQDDGGENMTAEPCPGCDQNLPRPFQGAINMIWRDGPVFKRGADNRIVRGPDNKPIIEGRADILAVWKSGIMVFGTLRRKSITYKDLRSRDFRITRSGTGLQTTYDIEPADPDAGPQEMSEADKTLAADKYDNSDLMAKPSYETWGAKPQQQQRTEAPPQADVSPFMRGRS